MLQISQFATEGFATAFEKMTGLLNILDLHVGNGFGGANNNNNNNNGGFGGANNNNNNNGGGGGANNNNNNNNGRKLLQPFFPCATASPLCLDTVVCKSASLRHLAYG